MPSDWTPLLTMLAQMTLALGAGGLVGLERSFHGRAAGFRTFSLVAFGSCILMMASSNTTGWHHPPIPGASSMDPQRVLQGIVTGVGFLGAGVIFRDGFTVRGLTTAACIWVVSAIGVLFGIGFYEMGCAATLLTLIVLSLFKRIEALMPSQQYTHLSIGFLRSDAPSEAALRERFRKQGMEIIEIAYGVKDKGDLFEYQATVRTAKIDNIRQLVDELRVDPQVIKFRLSPTKD
ncbi:MgtC/SapB family protein [Herbaspirillum autotrophicum]|uniref:MgtC/SapB family protein n=1 Tax=Herbaspirillum autotrophicum TaxID=180195 RepID=UPI0009F94B62|nr:MgtC/SapB family protein [Herbaspirillum autotrophicum]